MGSALLCDAVAAITSSIRSVDIAARVGGDEFCVLLAKGDVAADRVIARLDRAVRSRNEEPHPSTLSISLGVATSTSEEPLTLVP